MSTPNPWVDALVGVLAITCLFVLLFYVVPVLGL